MKSKNQKESRLENINKRLSILVAYRDNGQDLKAARKTATDSPVTYITYTAAYKYLKSMPRELREQYEKEIHAEGNAAADHLEKQRVALRSTDRPSELHKERKVQKEKKSK